MQDRCQGDLIEVGWVLVGHLEAADKKAAHLSAGTEERCAAMARRLCALALHLFGHLNGLMHHDDAHGYYVRYSNRRGSRPYDPLFCRASAASRGEPAPSGGSAA